MKIAKPALNDEINRVIDGETSTAVGGLPNPVVIQVRVTNISYDVNNNNEEYSSAYVDASFFLNFDFM